MPFVAFFTLKQQQHTKLLVKGNVCSTLPFDFYIWSSFKYKIMKCWSQIVAITWHFLRSLTMLKFDNMKTVLKLKHVAIILDFRYVFPLRLQMQWSNISHEEMAYFHFLLRNEYTFARDILTKEDLQEPKMFWSLQDS